LLLAVLTAFAISMLIFAIMRLLPGDPLAILIGIDMEYRDFSPAERARLEAELGLDRPLVVQYADWMRGVATGQMGDSFFRGDNVAQLIKERAPLTFQIGIFAVVLSWLVGLPVGVLSALRPNTWGDTAARVVTVFFLAIPSFWFALLILILLTSIWEYHPPIYSVDIWDSPWNNLQIVIAPTIVMGLGLAAYLARISRSTMLEVIGNDYIRTARAKGLRERAVLIHHALRNAVLPVITVSGVQLGFVIGGSVAVEKALGVPGIGSAMVTGALERDMNLVQNLVLVYGGVFIVVNLIIDLSYGFLDPRIRYA
jgi:peptide/nickel transport system permease protein